jgi:hypothetical protein
VPGAEDLYRIGSLGRIPATDEKHNRYEDRNIPSDGAPLPLHTSLATS